MDSEFNARKGVLSRWTAGLLALAGLLSVENLGAQKVETRPTTVETKPPMAELKLNQQRDFYDSPIAVVMTASVPVAEIYFTTNGVAPSPVSGRLYEHPAAISSTTVLRAAGFQNGAAKTEATTHSYLFARDVMKQTGAGFPKTWGLNQGMPVAADYEMED